MGRFQYLLWWRVFPFTPHWYMNLAGGLLGKKNICPVREFLVAAFIGATRKHAELNAASLHSLGAERLGCRLAAVGLLLL
jgi:uncharacterized membrane protein YdjX (TVP38/TMEM64 family)